VGITVELAAWLPKKLAVNGIASVVEVAEALRVILAVLMI